MTTPAAERLYQAQHEVLMEGRRHAVYNPHNKPLEELPHIYGFNNGGPAGWLQAVLIAEDGTFLGGHLCSHECYMRHDLGILEGTREDRHEDFRKHYPDGYRMGFVTHENFPHCLELHAALRLSDDKAAQNSKEPETQPVEGETK